MNFMGMGGVELIVIAGLAFFLLGPKKMIEVSRNAGKIIRDLKSERDKLTRMVMQEFDPDEKASDATRSTDEGGATAGGAGTADPPEGAVSRPRERVGGTADDGDARSGASSDSADGPVPPAGTSA